MAVTLTVQDRDKKTKLSGDMIPAVVYGPKQPTRSLALVRKGLEKIVHEAGESTIITLTGITPTIDVLIHDVAFSAERGGITHLDFYAIEAGKELTTAVPLAFVGEAPVTKTGGVLTKVLHEVEVTCRPADLPKEIVVDVSALATIDAALHVKDLVTPKGVKINNPAEDVVVIAGAVTEEAADTAGSIDMSAITVEKKGKDEAAE